MNYPKSKETMPTIFMMGCGATQVAAEDIFPISANRTTDSKETTQRSSAYETEKQNSNIPPSKNKFALLIGINRYGGLGNLNGCINDVSDVKAKLLEMGWNLNNVKVLIEEQATKNEILQGLKWLVSHCNVEDSLWFHFSGHGSWTLTPQGVGWECCICSYNCSDDWDNGVITRSEFNNALERPAGILSVFLDSCFSGGMSSTYPSWKEIPVEVHNLLYGESRAERIFPGVRALPGPEWLPLSSACTRLNLPQEELIKRINEGSIKSRDVIGGSQHVLI